MIERLREAATHKLTIVSAPAGFGKTTLVSEWLADPTAGTSIAAWVSLDATENDPSHFWAYAISALQKVHALVGKRALSLLLGPQPPPAEYALTSLINDINTIDSDFVLVFDDYHVIDAAAVHNSVAFLLDHMPPRLHLVLASRSDPPLPLAKLRARGELTELRPTDLRFTGDEASAFLNREMGLALSATDTATLEQRTEGWIAGLKLAAVSMKGRDDRHGFVDAFSGDNRYIADYLVEEVLQREPGLVRNFLLATSILARLSGPLCDSVTGEPGSQLLLDELERRNLFIVALDDKREWYRYHHLFADVLQAYAARVDADRLHSSHTRASVWYERNGSLEDAVRHALAAQDTERAANLLETKWPAMDRSHQSYGWLKRVKTLPDDVVRARPVLSMAYAWGLLNGGELEAAELRLRDVERWLDVARDAESRGEAAPGMVMVDEARFRSLPAELVPARLYLAGALGDTPGTVAHARRALDLIPVDQHAKRSTALALLSLAQWAGGELELAHDTFSDALDCMLAGGDPLSNIRGMFVLGDIRMVQGRLREAEKAYARGLRKAAEYVSAALAETDELHLGLSELQRERGDVDAARGQLLTLANSDGRAAHAGNRQRWCTTMARVREAEGNLDGALELLVEAETVDVRSPLPRPRPIGAIKARIYLAQGRLADAVGWARDRGLAVDDDLSYMREFEHITLARTLMARRSAEGDARFGHEALKLLERLTAAAEIGGRMGAAIETLVLQALTHQALGNARGAREPLERAMAFAEPEGYLRVFLDEGPAMRDLLRGAATRGIGGAYAPRILAAFDAPPPAATSAQAVVSSAGVLLTARELVILRLIAAGMRNQDIAQHLSISAATVKRHIANTYRKLDVRHRTEALVKANELKLL
ncbi:MAG: LuxR C-terminal-related transcriptional regulator [Gemmatimonadaceae bacterium]